MYLVLAPGCDGHGPGLNPALIAGWFTVSFTVLGYQICRTDDPAAQNLVTVLTVPEADQTITDYLLNQR